MLTGCRHVVITDALILCEGVDKNSSVYPDFKPFFRSAMRGDGLPLRRVGGECAGFAQCCVGRRHHYAPNRKIHLEHPGDDLEGD